MFDSYETIRFPVWKDLLKIRHIYLKGRKFRVNMERRLASRLMLG
jgi:hypothetical protein